MWTPCFRKGKGNAALYASVVPPACSKNTSCYDSSISDTTKASFVNTYSLSSGYTNGTDKQSLEVVVIAQDGHLLYGPWDQNGNQWTCDSHDICNGAFLPDGSYGYVMTTTFPYTLGCYGPGPVQSGSAACSTNSQCSSSNYKSAFPSTLAQTESYSSGPKMSGSRSQISAKFLDENEYY